MFTGLIEGVGELVAVDRSDGDARMRFSTPTHIGDELAIGDSLAVSGVCLTVTKPHPDGFDFDVSNETLAITTLGDLQVGSPVNLERPLLPTTRLGGHIVSGHVDGVGKITRVVADARSTRFQIEPPEQLRRYIAAKGSIAIEGVSLTVNEVETSVFGVNIIPHTLEATTIGRWNEGTRVNLEVDIIARYAERLITGDVT